MAGSEWEVSVNKVQCIYIPKFESSHSKSRQDLWNNPWNGSFFNKVAGFETSLKKFLHLALFNHFV